jgi:hypothetical protein
VAVLVIWMSFAFGVRELRGDVLSMIETHIMMSSLISCLVLTLIFYLALTLGLRLALLHVFFLQFSYGPNYHLYDFGPRENRFEPKRFDYDPRPRRSDRLPRKPNFSNGGSFPHYYTCVLPGLGFAFAELSQPRKIAAQVLLLAARFIFH